MLWEDHIEFQEQKTVSLFYIGNMAVVRLLILLTSLLLMTSVETRHHLPLRAVNVGRRFHVNRPKSDKAYRSGYHLDGLMKRHDCDPGQTDCPGMLKSATRSNSYH